MSLWQVLYILWRRVWIIAIALASTLAGAAGLMLLVSPRYEATAMASIDPGQADPVSIGQPSIAGLLGAFQGNMVALAKSNRVALDVVKRLNMSADPRSIERYSASNAVGIIDINQWLANDLVEHVEAKFGDKSSISNVLSIT
jgi:polysaccharide biosynthesis transport protein